MFSTIERNTSTVQENPWNNPDPFLFSLSDIFFFGGGGNDWQNTDLVIQYVTPWVRSMDLKQASELIEETLGYYIFMEDSNRSQTDHERTATGDRQIRRGQQQVTDRSGEDSNR